MSEEGVEFANEEDEVGGALKLSDFSEAVLWGTDWTIETVLAQLKRGNIELNPRFQRRDAWSKSTKSRFIESVILGLPVPQVVLAEHKDQRGRYIILDGKQRLLSLMQFAGLAEEGFNEFGLSGLSVRSDLNRKKFKHLEKRPELRNDFDAFLTHTIRTTVIRNWPSLTFLHVVFQRLNTGSLKLSPQELRQALAPGSFTNFVDDATIDSVETHRLLGRNSPDPRMRDVELLVRFIAFRLLLRSYAGRMKEFLDDSCAYFNARWESERDTVEEATRNFKQGIVALEEIFGEGGVARKLNSKLFNRSIFDALIFYASVPSVRERMIQRADGVRRAYQELTMNENFQEAVESDTAGIPHTAARLQLWGTALSRTLDTDLNVPQLASNAQGEMRFTE